MSCSIKIVRTDDFAGDVDTVDLSASGYSLATDGYFQNVAPIGARSVIESITLKLRGTSKNNLAALIQDIDEKIKQVQWWIESPGVEKYQVWLRVQLDNESYPRQAQILNVRPPDKVKTFTVSEMINNYIGEYQLGIERTPFWEDVAVTSSGATLSITGNIGGKIQWGNTVTGDVPGRLQNFQFDLSAINEPNENKMWFGFKTARFGNPANFVPYWAFSLGVRSSDTTITTDGNGRNIIKCDFSSSTALTRRVYLFLSQVTANLSDQRGSYLVLLAAKVDSGTVARARIAYGDSVFVMQSAPTYRSRVVIENTLAWTTFEMGNVDIPTSYLRSSDSLEFWSMRLDVERLSGSGDFYAYGFFLIPLEAAITVTPKGSSDIQDGPHTVLTRPDEYIVSRMFNRSTGALSGEDVIQPVRWGLPGASEKPYLVGAIGEGYGGPANSQIDVTYRYVKRWRTLRGNNP